MNRADLKMYSPERWYFNQYENGRLISSLGFKTKPLAESFARSVEEEAESMIRSGAKRRPGITERVEEAKGWSVDGKEFSDFHEALWYMWTEKPNATIKGVFK